MKARGLQRLVRADLFRYEGKSNWIHFYPWDANFIVNCADQLNVDILDLRTDSHKNRLYFVWRTK